MRVVKPTVTVQCDLRLGTCGVCEADDPLIPNDFHHAHPWSSAENAIANTSAQSSPVANPKHRALSTISHHTRQAVHARANIAGKHYPTVGGRIWAASDITGQRHRWNHRDLLEGFQLPIATVSKSSKINLKNSGNSSPQNYSYSNLKQTRSLHQGTAGQPGRKLWPFCCPM